MIIDFHTHLFPDALAERAQKKLLDSIDNLYTPAHDMKKSSLVSCMEKWGIDISVVQPVITKASQLTGTNEWAKSICDEHIISFGGIYPKSETWKADIDYVVSLGLKGLKFHPEYQHFYANEERMKPFYRKISELGLITLFHAGQDIGFGPPYHCLPEHLLGAIKWLDTPVVAAHWGGYNCGLEVLEKLCGENLYFDLSYGYGCIPKPTAQAIIDRHSPDKLLFGSDMPWHRPEWELRLINSLDLSESDKEKIFFRNAMKLLNL